MRLPPARQVKMSNSVWPSSALQGLARRAGLAFAVITAMAVVPWLIFCGNLIVVLPSTLQSHRTAIRWWFNDPQPASVEVVPDRRDTLSVRVFEKEDNGFPVDVITISLRGRNLRCASALLEERADSPMFSGSSTRRTHAAVGFVSLGRTGNAVSGRFWLFFGHILASGEFSGAWTAGQGSTEKAAQREASLESM